MVAPVDTFVYFASRELYDRLKDRFEQRSELGVIGGGRVELRVAVESISAAVDAARGQIGGAPLGFVTATEADALEAIGAGADEAALLPSADLGGITAFLDRVRVRAVVRRQSDRQHQDLAQAEKLTALGTLVAGVGHELNNPLSMITLGFDFLQDALLPSLTAIWEIKDRFDLNGGISPEECGELLRHLRSNAIDVRDILTDMSCATETVAQLVQDLRVFTRTNLVERPSLFQPRGVIEQALRLVRREFGAATVIEQDYGDDLPALYLPRNRLAQVITNLLVNAAYAMREVKRETHRLRVSTHMDEQHLAISITDTGPGIPEEALERIFDPFFTTKREGQGTGLGLSISRSIVQHMGGDLSVTSVYGDGATFHCFLPLPTVQDLSQAVRVHRDSLPSSPPSHERRSVLIIDDDERVLRAAARALREQFKVLVARDGQEALELLASGSQADVVIMEAALPELDGPEFFDWLRRRAPDLARRVIVATAAQERPEYREFLETEGLTVLHKPFNREALLSAVESACSEGRVCSQAGESAPPPPV